jgi:hypothetical protein
MVSAMAQFGNRKEDFSIVLLWHIIQHGTLQSQLGLDFQTWLKNSGKAPNLWSFLNWELFGDGIGFSLTVSVIILAVEVLYATLGGALGQRRVLLLANSRRIHLDTAAL